MFDKKSDNYWRFGIKCVFLQQIIPMMKQEIHPLIQNAALIEEQGILVLENVTHMPAYGDPIVSPYFVLALNHQGWVHAEYDFGPSYFHQHDFALIYPNHVLKALDSSDDYQATLLVLSSRFLNLLRETYPNHLRFEYHFNSLLHLNDLQYEGICSSLRQMKVISRLDHPDRGELLMSQVDILAHLTEIYMEQNGNTFLEKATPVQQLLVRFIAAVAEHFCESREVKFYARLLCLSPKHFGTVIRQATGIGAGEWIARYVIVQAKHYLHHHRNLTIQQISDRLGFCDQTAFTRYFRNNAGMTPKEYRERGQKLSAGVRPQ